SEVDMSSYDVPSSIPHPPSPVIFGIRHHGPGSARSLRRALETLRPDIILVEGPPDAADVLPLLAHPDMRPPIALLLYPADVSPLGLLPLRRLLARVAGAPLRADLRRPGAVHGFAASLPVGGWGSGDGGWGFAARR